MSEEPRAPKPERPPAWIIVGIVGLLVLMALSSAPATKWMQRMRYEGKAAPELGLPMLSTPDERISLAAFQGKVVLLDFWATWCPPCRKQMPVLERLSRDAALADRLQVLSINTDEDEPERAALVARFMQHNRYRMTTLLDDGRAMQAYRITSIPTLVVISPSGEVAHLLHGVHTEEELRRLIDEVGGAE